MRKAFRPAFVLTLLLAAPSIVPASDTEAVPSLIGAWMGEAEHNGQPARLAIEFFEHEEAGLVARLALPDLHAWEVALKRVNHEGDQIRIGDWTLVRQEDGTLGGHMPAFFVPVHQIPVVFRRVEALEKTERAPIEAPLPESVWTRDLGSEVWAGLTARARSLFVGTDDGRLLALEVSTGETSWEFATEGPIRAQPTVDGDRVLVHSDDGHLYALDTGIGAELWRAPTSAVERIAHGAEGSRYNDHSSSAVVAGGSVYVGAFDGSVVALEGETGKELWRFRAGDTVAGTPSVTEGRVFFGSFDNHVYALDAETGQELWRFDAGQPVTTSPLAHDGLVVIGSRSYDLFALDAATGDPQWKYYYWFSWVESSAAERDDVAYIGSSDAGQLNAIDLATGKLRWVFDAQGVAWPRPAVTEAAVFAGTFGTAGYWADHRAAFYAVDRQTGKPIWRLPQERPSEATIWGFAAAPAVHGSLVFAADLSGRVYAFRQ